MLQRKLKKKFSMLLALMLTFGTMFSGTMSVHAEEAPQEILSLTFDTDEVKEPVLGETVPDSFNVQPNDGNSLTDDSEVFLSWRVKQADGTWDYAKPTSETVQFEAGKEYRLRFDIQNLKAVDGKAFPDNVPVVQVNDMNVSVVTDDNVTDSYYTKTDDTTVSFAMYSKSFKIEGKTEKQLPDSKDVTPMKSQEDNNSFRLSFDIERPQFSDLENFNATYSNYWMSQPKNDIFDEVKWQLNDFSVRHNLYVDGYDGPFVRHLIYTAATYTPTEIMHFEDISIPYGEVEVEYYTPKDSDYFEPYLFEYNLYLEKSDNKMILRVPRLRPQKSYTGSEEILRFNNLKISEIGTKLYLDGESGDDNLDGTTPENAVKTFEKAKELSAANQNIKQIIVIGTTDIQGEVSLVGTNAQILRGENFNGYLFSVGPGESASLADIVIDGNSENNANIEKSLIEINSNATLNINSGANLKNNKIKAIKDTATNGGAIYAYSATINMSGGIIDNNQATYGGGIHLNRSTMNFSGGIIQNNKSDLVIDTSVSPTQYYSAGGGILANEGSTINMSADAKVLDNYAKEIGGGISLGSNQWGTSNILKMIGGTIDGNTAGSAGGGIFVQAKYFSGGASKAYIDGGEITNNQMDATGYTEKMFGGGGIYVNGANDNYGVNGANGELYLKNVVITDNESTYEGAGYASCPISKTKIYVTNGGAIYGNKTTSNVNEIYILCNKYLGLHGGNPEYDISERMLGGVPYNWKNKDNSPLDESKHKGILSKNNEYLGLHTDEEGNELTSNLKKVLISGNKSNTRGGGIGSNGTVTIGSDETTSVSVEKKWIEDNSVNPKHPEAVTVKLIANVDNKEYEIESKQLSEKNSWKTTFKDLPTKAGEKDIIYSIKEVDVEGYTSKIDGTAKDGFIITNTRIPSKISVQVTKAWEDKNDQDGKRPNSVTIKLLADGKETGKTLTLTKTNNWTGSFADLDEYNNGKKIEYTVKEETIGSSYVSVVTGSMKDGYTVTNTREVEKIKVEGSKTWNDKGNQDGKRPSEIKITLLKNGKTFQTKTVKEAEGWKWKFENLDKYENGKEIIYTISEEKVEGYTTEINGYDVKNSYTPGKTSIQVTKAWEDKNDQDGKRPNSVTIKLLANGKETGKTLTLTKTNNWTGSFADLDEYKNGKKIEYTVKEETVGNGYTSVITGSVEKGYVVTNIRTPNIPPEKPNKESPKTGDAANLSLYTMLIGLSGALLVVLGFGKRQKN